MATLIHRDFSDPGDTPVSVPCSNKTGPCRVRFGTTCIRPVSLPPFPYATSVWGPSDLQYTALLPVDDVGNASRTVRAFWPDAVLYFVEVGGTEFCEEDTKLRAHTLGTEEKEPEPTGFRAWLRRHHIW